MKISRSTSKHAAMGVLFLATLILMTHCRLGAQQPSANLAQTYQLIKATSLSNSTETITVQQPASPTATIALQWVSVNCPAACTIAFSQNGTAATATSLTPTKLNGSPTATATGWSASNVSGGTTLSSFTVATGIYTFDVSAFYLGRGQGTAQNFSVACTIATSGTCALTMQWMELPN